MGLWATKLAVSWRVVCFRLFLLGSLFTSFREDQGMSEASIDDGLALINHFYASKF